MILQKILIILHILTSEKYNYDKQRHRKTLDHIAIYKKPHQFPDNVAADPFISIT